MKILFVDDHVDTALLMSRILKAQGHEVETADTVASALELASKDRFDLLVSDLGLPDGNGLDLMRELASKYGMRGIAVTGHGYAEDIERTRDAGFTAHLVKPVRLESLKAAIQQFA